MRTGIVVAVLAVIALLWFNPDMEDFATFVEAQSEKIVVQETGEGRLGRALGRIVGGLAGANVDRVTERDNYFVFSTYTLDLDGTESTANDWRFLGIAGQFFELHRPEDLRRDEP